MRFAVSPYNDYDKAVHMVAAEGVVIHVHANESVAVPLARTLALAPEMAEFLRRLLTSTDYDRDEREARALLARIDTA